MTSLNERIYDQLLSDGHRTLADEYAEANSSRLLSVTPQPLDDGHILGLRERLATAKHHGAEFEFDHGFGFGSTTLSITAIFPGGRQVSETIQLSGLLAKWATDVIDSNFIVRADADDSSTEGEDQ